MRVEAALKWINDNREWIGGIGVILTILAPFWKFRSAKQRARVQQSLRSGNPSRNIQVDRDVNISSTVVDSAREASAKILKDLERMGDLFASLRGGLSEHPFVREFFVLRNKDIQIGFVDYPRFRLHADEIPDLVGKVHILKRHGFVRDVTRGNAPIYRMSEDFVEYLNATR